MTFAQLSTIEALESRAGTTVEVIAEPAPFVELSVARRTRGDEIVYLMDENGKLAA